MVLEKIEAESRSIELSKGRVLLYHGSKSGIEGDIEPKSRKQCDFGEGFYMGTEPSQALTLICDYESAKFYIVSISVEDLAVLDVSADLEWAMIVAYHRGRTEKIKDTPFYNKYQEITKEKDLVIGSIANDRMFFVIDNFFIGNITDAVRIEKEVPISYLEKLFMKEAAEENRVKGTSLANDICRR